jgi:hypothetical protein
MPDTTESPRIQALRSAPLDSWIALSEDESKVIATGPTYQDAAEQSERAGVSDPIIIKTPARRLSFSV